MKKLAIINAAVLVSAAVIFFPVRAVYAEESGKASPEEASEEDTVTEISASEAAVLERIEAEKAAIEAAGSAIEKAAQINQFTSDSFIADRIIAEKEAISGAHEDIERAADINKEKEYADIVDSMPDHTYIDIDLTKQKLTYYINGGVTIASDIVSGNVSRHCDTPQGVYQIYGKQKSRTLRGPNYAAFVNYWMPFTGNYGIHDATWRSSFGGDI